MRQSFVSGHGFSRAEPHPKKTWPLGPEAKNETLVEFINEFLIHHESQNLANVGFGVASKLRKNLGLEEETLASPSNPISQVLW